MDCTGRLRGRACGWHALLLLLATLSVASCLDQGDPRLDVRLDSGHAEEPPPPAANPDAPAPLRFVYASVLSPERSVLTYARLGTYLSVKMGRSVEIVRRRTYGELNELLRTGGAEAGLVCTGAFAAGEDEFGLEAIAIPVIDGKTTYQSYVIARRESGMQSFEDTRGTVFAFTDPLSNTGYRYVNAKLHDRGLEADHYFARFLFTYSHDNSIEAVLDGIADAGSVDSLVWDELLRRDPTLGHDLVIIDESEDFPINPVAAAPGIDPELRALLARTFLEMADDPEGREVLAELGTEAFVEPTAETQAGYEAIARSWQALGGGPPGDGGSD